jgi:hypothetical protein
VPRYFFHVYDDVVALDDEGLELENVTIARDSAVSAARALAAAQIMEQGKVNIRHRIDVEDEERRPVLTLPFSAAFGVVDE